MDDIPVLAHRVSGSGTADPVLLMNGGMMTHVGWNQVASGLASSMPVIGFDFRGQLMSPGTPPPSIDGHVPDVVALLDHLQVPRVHVVGTSFGAEVAVVLAASHPERVRSLSAITAGDRVTPEMWAAAQPLREAARAAAAGGDGGVLLDLMMPSAFSPAYLTAQAGALALRRQQFAALPRAWFQGLDGLLGSLEQLDLRPLLGRITCPTLVVGAELDRTFPIEHSRALAAGIPGAQLEIVPGSGHALVAEAPDRLLEILLSFLTASS